MEYSVGGDGPKLSSRIRCRLAVHVPAEGLDPMQGCTARTGAEASVVGKGGRRNKTKRVTEVGRAKAEKTCSVQRVRMMWR